MICLSIPLRLTLARLSLPVLIALAFATLLLGKADTLLAERARMAVADLLTPIWGSLRQPAAALRDATQDIREFMGLRAEVANLREENARLRRWHAGVLVLEAENALLRRQLGFVPDAAPAFQTARVVADGGGT